MRSLGEGDARKEPTPPEKSLGGRALSGVTWVGSTKFLRHGLQYLLHIVLARILYPSDFGVFGIVLIFIELGVLLNELGLSTALIQRRSIDRNDADTAFWGIAGSSAVLFALLWFAAGPVATFFGRPELNGLVRIGALTYVFASLGAVPVALLTRDMYFRRLLVPEVGGVLVGNGVAIGLALGGIGAASLVWGQVVTAGTLSVLALFAARWRPRLVFDWARMRGLFSFGGYVVGRRMVDYVAASIVYVIIARGLGETVAGLYLIITRLTTLPQYAFSSVLGRVALSAFSRVQDEDERINRGFLLMTRYTVLLSAAGLVILSALAPEFLTVVYGPPWSKGAEPLALLAVMGLINAAVSQPGVMWLAKGRPEISFFWAVLMAVTLVAAGSAGMPWGLTGVAAALTLRSLVFFPIPPLITRRLTGLPPRDYYEVLLPYLAAGGFSWAVLAYLARSRLVPWPDDSWFFVTPDVFRLVTLSVAGIVLYGWVLLWLRPATKDEVRGLYRRLRGGGDEAVRR